MSSMCSGGVPGVFRVGSLYGRRQGDGSFYGERSFSFYGDGSFYGDDSFYGEVPRSNGETTVLQKKFILCADGPNGPPF